MTLENEPETEGRTGMLHPSLPELPVRIKRLPVDSRGYPVPWFVAWIDNKPDFRVIDPKKVALAINEVRCWICGDKMGRYMAFVAGPMCAVNRTSGEPPSHRECAIFAAKACPFLVKPAVERRENDLPADIKMHSQHLAHNPGVALVWVTKGYRGYPSEGGILYQMGEPTEVLFFKEGREATREEILVAVDKGMPHLKDAARLQGKEAFRELGRAFDRFLTLLP